MATFTRREERMANCRPMEPLFLLLLKTMIWLKRRLKPREAVKVAAKARVEAAARVEVAAKAAVKAALRAAAAVLARATVRVGTKLPRSQHTSVEDTTQD